IEVLVNEKTTYVLDFIIGHGAGDDVFFPGKEQISWVGAEKRAAPK
ncbi:hypothetical protein Tco_1373231, partial [Tanacetum coccineum]